MFCFMYHSNRNFKLPLSLLLQEKYMMKVRNKFTHVLFVLLRMSVHIIQCLMLLTVGLDFAMKRNTSFMSTSTQLVFIPTH